MSAWAKDELALLRQVNHIRVLMTEELEHASKDFLIVTLPIEALLDVVSILVQNRELCLLVEQLLWIFHDHLFICIDKLSILLLSHFNLLDFLSQMQNVKTNCFNRDDLVRINIELPIVVCLWDEFFCIFKVFYGLVINLRNYQGVREHVMVIIGRWCTDFHWSIRGDWLWHYVNLFWNEWSWTQLWCLWRFIGC